MAGRKDRGGTPATVALAAAGVSHQLHAYTHDPRTASRSLSRSRSDRVEARSLSRSRSDRVEGRSLSRSRSDRVEGYGEEAAQALGVAPERVFKTLLASLDPGSGGRPELVVGVVPVSGRLDLKALARVLGGTRATMADVAAAERATGYVAGGISPFGQKRAHRTVIDDSALAHETVFVSGGRRGLDLEVSPADLVAVTSAVTATISR